LVEQGLGVMPSLRPVRDAESRPRPSESKGVLAETAPGLFFRCRP
jgi:hypothetical protein